MAEDLEKEGSEEIYADMLGTEAPVEVDADIKPGEVALSVPQKIDPIQIPEPVQNVVSEPEDNPEPEVVERIFSEPVVSDDGVALTVPPIVIRDGKRNFEEDIKPLFVKPAEFEEGDVLAEDVQETLDSTVSENDEMPSFIKNWKVDGEEDNSGSVLSDVFNEKTEGSVIPEFNFDEILKETDKPEESEINESSNVADMNVSEESDEHTIPPLDLLNEFNVEVSDDDETEVQGDAGDEEAETEAIVAEAEEVPAEQVIPVAEAEIREIDVAEPGEEPDAEDFSAAEAEETQEPEIATEVEETISEAVSETAEEPEKVEEERRTFNKNGGVQRFVAKAQSGVIELSDVADGELVNWNLLLADNILREVSVSEEDVSIPLPEKSFRKAEIIQGDQGALNVYNEENFRFARNSGNVLRQTDGAVILRDNSPVQMLINDWKVQNLESVAGETLTFETPQDGILIGPDGAVLFFGGVRSVVIPTAAEIKENLEQNMKRIAKSYAGTLKDQYAEYNSENLKGEFNGVAEKKSIHLDVGNTTYGWGVRFDNGLVMGLSDLREYQLRYGKMPMDSGTITYGKKQLHFRNVARVVYYEVPQYVSYR